MAWQCYSSTRRALGIPCSKAEKEVEEEEEEDEMRDDVVAVVVAAEAAPLEKVVADEKQMLVETLAPPLHALYFPHHY